ncbi:hypothetical protein BH23GEM2_BH23GEM2_24670 [soil metagenome]
MAGFLDSNPGLKSRFNKFIRFPDYDPADLLEIFRRMVTAHDYELQPDGEAVVSEILRDAYANRRQNFGNARLVRNLFEQIVAHHSNGVAMQANPSHEMLCQITVLDVPAAPVLH